MDNLQSILNKLQTHMETKKISDLKEYALNSVLTIITNSEYKRLKKDLTRDGQLESMLVMIDDDPKFNNTVLGGNKRLRAMKELGWYEAKCNTVLFKQEDEGWYAVVDGVPQRTQFYPSKEAAMFFYSIKHNDNKYGEYNKEQLLIYMDQFGIPYEEVHLNVEPIPSFAQVVNAGVNVDKIDTEIAITEDEKKEKKIKEIDVKCPFCQKEFKKEI